MKGISLILPGLGPPVQILPKHRRVHQHSSRTIRTISRHQRERVLILDNELQNGGFFVKHFPSSFHGDARAMKRQRPWAKEKFKDAFNLYPTKEPKRTMDVESFNRPYDESYRPPENYASLVTLFHTALSLNSLRRE